MPGAPSSVLAPSRLEAIAIRLFHGHEKAASSVIHCDSLSLMDHRQFLNSLEACVFDRVPRPAVLNDVLASCSTEQ